MGQGGQALWRQAGLTGEGQKAQMTGGALTEPIGSINAPCFRGGVATLNTMSLAVAADKAFYLPTADDGSRHNLFEEIAFELDLQVSA